MIASIALLAGLAGPWNGEPPSLTRALEAWRARAEAHRAELEPVVAQRVARAAAALRRGDATELAAARAELAALPPDAAPLLARALGATEGDGPAAREEVASALRSVGSAAAVPELALLAAGHEGPEEGPESEVRELALELLVETPTGESATARERRGAALVELWRALGPELRAPAGARLLAALLPLREPAAARALAAEALAAGGERARAALRALGEVPLDASDAVRDLVAREEDALPCLRELFDYHLARPQADPEEVRELFALLARPSVPEERRVGALQELGIGLAARERGDRGRATWTEALAHFAAGSRGRTREEAQVALVRLGDRDARRDLFDELDRLVAGNPRTAEGWMQRGGLLLRVGEVRDAADDFRRAYDLLRRYAEGRRKAGVALARALCLDGKLRQASDVLEELELSELQRAELARDPDFAELARDARWGDVLR